MESGFQIRYSEEETCPVCGEPIRYGLIPMVGKEFRLNCKCEDELLRKEQAARIATGDTIIREEMRRASGVPGKYRKALLSAAAPARGQEQAWQVCKDFIERFRANRKTAGIYFIGGVGSGKTFLAAAVAGQVMDEWHIPAWEAERVADGNPPRYAPVKFAGTVELLERLKRSYTGKDEGEKDLLESLKRAPLLILDDLGAEKVTEWSRERLFEIIDYRYNEELPLLVTTNLKPEVLRAQLGERICDRLKEMCVFAPMSAVSQRRGSP
ncbi:MAG: ATP-binding protein [Oscillospiraceae bacterium]|nr:ATP-binding protein [Oscillospiraceae bacterium]